MRIELYNRAENKNNTKDVEEIYLQYPRGTDF